MSIVDNLETLLAAGKDTPLLRFSLGNEYLKMGQAVRAVDHFSKAVAEDPAYSAAWKGYGRALVEAGRPRDALEAYRRGIEVAQAKGDIQAAREMTVFARRIEKQLGGS
jgi:Tfp pilus assembly protein PilF